MLSNSSLHLSPFRLSSFSIEALFSSCPLCLLCLFLLCSFLQHALFRIATPSHGFRPTAFWASPSQVSLFTYLLRTQKRSHLCCHVFCILLLRRTSSTSAATRATAGFTARACRSPRRSHVTSNSTSARHVRRRQADTHSTQAERQVCV